MGYDGKLLRQAQAQFERDRTVRQLRRREEIRSIYDRAPRLQEIQRQLRSTAGRIVAAALRRGEDPRPGLTALRRENLALQEERRKILAGMGLSESALDETPDCPLCEDKGFVGGEPCRCLRRYYTREQTKALSEMLDVGAQSFDSFSVEWYDDQKSPGERMSPREYMEWVYDHCVEYAHGFAPSSGNLLLFGAPGLGKTHLSASIAREVAAKGFSVVYDTAGHIFSCFEDRKFGRETDGQQVDRVMKCDLLILDDLGTEMTTEFVQSALYQIINGRLLARRSTVVSTNLMPEEIARRYSPQIASRLEGEYRMLAFVGEDIRKKKREEQER